VFIRNEAKKRKKVAGTGKKAEGREKKETSTFQRLEAGCWDCDRVRELKRGGSLHRG